MKKHQKKWAYWGFAVSFLAFQYVLRLFPGLMLSDIMKRFHVDAFSFGTLSAAYYFGYAGFQIPTGLLLSQWGPRRVISLWILLCGLGTLLFQQASVWWLAVFARFLIGVGSAVGFLGCLQVIKEFFPGKDLNFLIGISVTIGLMGALFGGNPLQILVPKLGWDLILQGAAALCFILALSVVVFFPKKSSLVSVHSASTWGVLKEVLSNQRILWISLFGALMVGPLEGFADVWGSSFLNKVYGLPKESASFISSSIFIGMLVGGPFLPFVMKSVQRKFFKLVAGCAFVMIACFGCILIPSVGRFFSPSAFFILFLLVGIGSSYQVVIFGAIAEEVRPELISVTISTVNCINMLGGCLFHASIGAIMDYFWDGKVIDGVRVYNADTYLSSVSVIPLGLILGMIGFLLIQKKQTEKKVIKAKHECNPVPSGSRG